MTARPLSPAEAAIAERFEASEPAPESWRPPLTALEWLRVTHADTLSGRRIEEALAAERERVAAPVRALAEEWERLGPYAPTSAESWQRDGLRRAAHEILRALDGPAPC